MLLQFDIMNKGLVFLLCLTNYKYKYFNKKTNKPLSLHPINLNNSKPIFARYLHKFIEILDKFVV